MINLTIVTKVLKVLCHCHHDCSRREKGKGRGLGRILFAFTCILLMKMHIKKHYYLLLIYIKSIFNKNIHIKNENRNAYYSYICKIAFFINGFSYKENFTTLSVKYIRLMWPKLGIICLSFSMRRTS